MVIKWRQDPLERVAIMIQEQRDVHDYDLINPKRRRDRIGQIEVMMNSGRLTRFERKVVHYPHHYR